MKSSHSLRLLSSLFALSLLAVPAMASAQQGMGDSTSSTKSEKNLLQAAKNAGNYNTFLIAVEAAGLQDTLSGAEPYTIFAPTDEAFAKLPKEQLDALLQDKEQLRSVLLYHVVPGKVNSSAAMQMKPGEPVTTAAGQGFTLSSRDGTLRVNDAKVVKPDIMASNGIIHGIDTVLIPR